MPLGPLAEEMEESASHHLFALRGCAPKNSPDVPERLGIEPEAQYNDFSDFPFFCNFAIFGLQIMKKEPFGRIENLFLEHDGLE